MLESITMNEPRFMALLEKLIGESVHLQNSPASGLIPKESLACKHILDVLNPFSKENGGVLSIKKIEFVEGRGNMIITYPGTNPNKVCSFVGSHLDVVPANPQNWERDPFKLTVDGDSLYGRGTTDCLGEFDYSINLFIIIWINMIINMISNYKYETEYIHLFIS